MDEDYRYGNIFKDGHFRDIFSNPLAVRMCGAKEKEIVELDVVEDLDRQNQIPYWAWEDAGNPGEFSMVFVALKNVLLLWNRG